MQHVCGLQDSFSLHDFTCYLFRTRPLTLMYSSSPRCTEPAAGCPNPSLNHSLWSSRTQHPVCYSPLTTQHIHQVFADWAAALHDGNDKHKDKIKMFVLFRINALWSGLEQYSQLSSCNVHSCLSMGYLVRSMLQAIVAVILLDHTRKTSLTSQEAACVSTGIAQCTSAFQIKSNFICKAPFLMM